MAARLVNVPPEPNRMCGTKTGFLVCLRRWRSMPDEQFVEAFGAMLVSA